MPHSDVARWRAAGQRARFEAGLGLRFDRLTSIPSMTIPYGATYNFGPAREMVYSLSVGFGLGKRK